MKYRKMRPRMSSTTFLCDFYLKFKYNQGLLPVWPAGLSLKIFLFTKHWRCFEPIWGLYPLSFMILGFWPAGWTGGFSRLNLNLCFYSFLSNFKLIENLSDQFPIIINEKEPCLTITTAILNRLIIKFPDFETSSRCRIG